MKRNGDVPFVDRALLLFLPGIALGHRKADRMTYLEFTRRTKKITQAQLAAIVRIDSQFISMCERGVALPVPDQLARFAKALNLAPEMVMEQVPLPLAPEEAAEVEAESARG